MASSSADRCRRLVTSTRLPPAPGSSGSTCSLLAASSSTSSSCFSASRSRHSAIRASRPAGICPAGTPAVSSRLASASAGSTGCWPGVCPCSGRKICPPGNLSASRCAACTANAVLPTPAMPPIAWMPTTAPAPTAASTSSCSSRCRPVNEAMSRGSVRIAAAPAVTGTAGAGRPRATASNSARAGSASRSAPASRRIVSRRGVVAMPRSRSLIDRGLKPVASASSSWVSRASVRSFRSRPAKVTGGSATASPLARTRRIHAEHMPPGARVPSGTSRVPRGMRSG